MSQDRWTPSFPSRSDAFEFRNQLEAKYQALNRPVQQTFVNREGEVVWTQDVPSTGGAFFANLHRLSGACIWTATTSASWITLVAPTTGDGSFGRVDFTAATNSGAQRTGNIRFDYPGGSATHQVIQGSSPYTVFFRMVDSFRSTAQTTECEIRGTATPCTLTASADLPGAKTYAGRLVYSYGIDKTITQTSSSNTFVLTEGCGGANSTTDGFFIDLDVTLTVRDDRGNEVTTANTPADDRVNPGGTPPVPVRIKV